MSVDIVTGGARGIGAAVCEGLARAGHRVVVADRDVDEATRMAEVLGNAGLLAEALEIDVLVANAGIGSYTDLATGDPHEWRAVVETNLLGVMHSVRAVLPGMKERGSGDIVLMASIAGRQVWTGEPIYISTKWGVVGFGWALRKEVLADGVRVTLVEPGTVDTPLVRSTEEGRAELARFAALQPEDVARSVVFAVSQPRHLSIGEVMVLPVGPEL
jgi:NADP-dependent 3-hydroxy acid dehydrogenase YdfG